MNSSINQLDTIYINRDICKPVYDVYQKIELMKYPKIPNKGYFLFLNMFDNEHIYLYNFLIHHSNEFHNYIKITNIPNVGMYELTSICKNKKLYIIYDELSWFLNIELSCVHNILVSKYYVHNYLYGIITIKKFIQWSII
jgi:hypothetical protein